MQSLTAEILSTNFIPPTLIAREKQLNILASDTPRPRNYFMQGWTNTGKTATVTKAIEILGQRPKHRCLYVKCERSLWMPFKHAVEQSIGPLPYRSDPPREFFKYCQNHEIKQTHIYLDDAHALAMYEKNSIRYTEAVHKLYECGKSYEVKVQMIVVGTLPYITFERFIECLHLDDRARGQFMPLIFDNYTGDELTAIYRDRLKLAKIEFAPAAVKWVSSTVKLNAGELPMGFDILYAAVEDMQSTQAKTLEISHAESAFQRVKIDYWKRQLSEMDHHSLLLFLSGTIIAMNKMLDNGGKDHSQIYITGQEVGREYERLCQANREKELYAQRRNYLLMKLSVQGFFSKTGFDTHSDSVRYRYELNPQTMMDTLKAMNMLPGNI